MDKLVQAGIMRSEDFEITPGERIGMMYKEQSCAMILKTQAALLMQKSRVGDDAPELRIMPFCSENDEDSDYFLSVPIYNMAVSKRLEDAGNENSWKWSRKYLLASALSKGKKALLIKTLLS